MVQLLTDLSNVTLDVFCILPVKFYLHLTATNEQSHKHKPNWTPPGRSEVTKSLYEHCSCPILQVAFLPGFTFNVGALFPFHFYKLQVS